MRLVDADDLRQVLEVFSEKDSLGHTPVQLCDAMPTIDAVEVVHCRDCKWLHIVNDNILYGFCTKGHAMFYPFQLDTREFYCADGERRE